jgi:hypothetical protein
MIGNTFAAKLAASFRLLAFALAPASGGSWQSFKLHFRPHTS